MDFTTAATLSITILLAFTGYLATYVYNLRLAQRRDRLERLNHQLSDLYGPLFALQTSATYIWTEFRARNRAGFSSYWDPSAPPSTVEEQAWRLWMREVFMPLNLQMSDVIVRNAALLEESTVPECLLRLCAHVAAYRAVMKKWKGGDYSENTSWMTFPREDLVHYTSETFRRLKEEQRRLLAASKLPGYG